MFKVLLQLFVSLATADVSDQDIIKDVLSSFPSIKMAQDDIKIAKGEKQFAEGAFDINLKTQYSKSTGDYEYEFLQSRIVKPTSLFGLDLYAGFRKSDGNIPVYDGQLETLSNGEFQVGLQLPLLRGFWIDERRALLEKNKLLVEQRQYQLRASELEQIRIALHRYWDWRLSLQRLSIQTHLLEIALERDKWLGKRSKAGDIARFEKDDNQRTILQRQSLLLQAGQSYQQALSELQFFVENAETRARLQKVEATKKEFPRPPSLQTYFQDADILIDLAFKNRPDFESLQLQKRQLKVDEKLQSNRFLPQLDLEAQYSKDNGQGSSTLNDENAKLSLQLEIPLQYRRLRGRAEQIEGAQSRIDNQLRLLTQRTRADIVINQKNLQIANQRFDLAKAEVLLAQRLETGENLRLRQGETNILTVNLREQATAEAEFRYAEAAVEVLKNLITLKTLLGELPS